MPEMRGKILALFVFAPWLFLVVCQPLMQPLSGGRLANDQNGDETAVASSWWLTETSADDPKSTLFTLCWERPGDVVFEFVCGAVFGRLAVQLGGVAKVVNIHELVRVYLI